MHALIGCIVPLLSPSPKGGQINNTQTKDGGKPDDSRMRRKRSGALKGRQAATGPFSYLVT